MMEPFNSVKGWMFVDPGRSTGVCHLTGDMIVEPWCTRAWILSAETPWPEALDQYRVDMVELIKKKAPLVVCVEDYARQARGSQAVKMIEIGTAVRMAAADTQVPIIEMNIGLWKSITFRRKKDTAPRKREYILQTWKLTDVKVDNVDEADALLMAWAAGTILGDRTRRTDGMEKFRRRVQGVLGG